MYPFIEYMIENKKRIALQAQVHHENQASCPSEGFWKKLFGESNQKGSVTVEASLLLPFFLCAVCTVCVIGQFILAESAIYHATAQTARIYAKQESALQIRKNSKATKKTGDAKGNVVKNSGNGDTSEGMIARLGGILETAVIFSRYIEKRDAHESYVLGGKNGVIVQNHKMKDYVEAKASYCLRVPVPFFRMFLFPRTITVKRRLFTGYVPYSRKGSGQGAGKNLVYVAKNGGVYHTSLDCYHLCINISDPKKVKKALQNSSYKKCKKCMGNSSNPSQIYITREGDHIHSSLLCSGLKREIAAHNLEDVKGMRMCSECAKHRK